MKQSTRWIILIVYYTSQLLGILPYSYNVDTGEKGTSLAITLYSSIISLFMFTSVPILFRVQWKPRNTNGPELHIKISALMCLIRIISVLITIIMNWVKKKEFIETLSELQRVKDNFLNKFKMSQKVENYFDNSIRSKFFWGFISNVMVFISSYDILRGTFNIDSPIIILGLGTLSTVLNIIMTHYFFALLNVNTLLAVINEEVKRILNTSSALFKLQRLKQIKPGVFMNTCCKLADELDELAMNQYKLQQIGEHVNRNYDIQGACVLVTLYMNNISIIYMSYMLFQHEELSQEFGVIWVMAILTIVLFFFYKDMHVFMVNMLQFGDFIAETASLLKNHQHWLPTLDERFEKSLKDFSIQLALFPLEMKLLGLFQFNRSMSFATFGSTISNAIVLMQYDYKYNKN
ncbi:putative gustatory receptor 59d [Cochliomyia hominivorax]